MTPVYFSLCMSELHFSVDFNKLNDDDDDDDDDDPPRLVESVDLNVHVCVLA